MDLQYQSECDCGRRDEETSSCSTCGAFTCYHCKRNDNTACIICYEDEIECDDIIQFNIPLHLRIHARIHASTARVSPVNISNSNKNIIQQELANRLANRLNNLYQQLISE